jgi:hypothetical protein
MKKKILYFALVPFLLLLQNNQLYAMKRQRSDDTYWELEPIKKKGFPCSYCNLVCAHYSKKVIHERVHTGEKPFECAQCLTSFARQYTLKQHHIKVHTEKRAFQCDQCTASYGRQGDLTNHITKIHTKKEFLNYYSIPIAQSHLPNTIVPPNHINKNLMVVATAKNVPQQQIADLFPYQSDPFERECIAWLNE